MAHHDLNVCFRYIFHLLSVLRSAPLSQLSRTVTVALSLSTARGRDLTARSGGLSYVREEASKMKSTVTTHFVVAHAGKLDGDKTDLHYRYRNLQ